MLVLAPARSATVAAAAAAVASAAATTAWPTRVWRRGPCQQGHQRLARVLPRSAGSAASEEKTRGTNMNIGATVTVRVTSVDSMGRGVGVTDGGEAVVVPFTLPGEEVTAVLWGPHGLERAVRDGGGSRGRARRLRRENVDSEAATPPLPEADLVRVTLASSERVEPRCPLFGTCGGCQLQHATLSLQRSIKRSNVAAVLEAAIPGAASVVRGASSVAGVTCGTICTDDSDLVGTC
jgi:hypothetical protein